MAKYSLVLRELIPILVVHIPALYQLVFKIKSFSSLTYCFVYWTISLAQLSAG